MFEDFFGGVRWSDRFDVLVEVFELEEIEDDLYDAYIDYTWHETVEEILKGYGVPDEKLGEWGELDDAEFEAKMEAHRFYFDRQMERTDLDLNELADWIRGEYEDTGEWPEVESP